MLETCDSPTVSLKALSLHKSIWVSVATLLHVNHFVFKVYIFY